MDAVTQSAAPVVLAREPGFRIGPMEVRPETCELIDGGRSIILEPRVMQVLVALHRAEGHVVSRDDLLRCCWQGRIVGDDAIHRVISRLRHEAEQSGGHFRVETITKVGYRLVSEDFATSKAAASSLATSDPKRVSRRALMGGGAGIAAIIAGAWGIDRWQHPSMPEAARAKLDEGLKLWDLGTTDGYAAAEAAFRRAAAIAPDHAEPWGVLSLSYAYQSNAGHPAIAAEAERNARMTMARALSIDPREPFATATGITLDFDRAGAPLAAIERRILAAHRAFPERVLFLDFQSFFLSQVGRIRSAVQYLDEWLELAPELPPRVAAARAYLLFHAGRADEAEQLDAALIERWPRHTSVWFSSLKRLMYSGRYDRALAKLEDVARRPVGIPDWNFDLSRLQTLALMNPARHEAEASRQTMEAARQGTGFAENGMLYFAARGRVNEAFAIADALYFNRGFRIGPQRFTREQGHHDNRRRRTSVLFERGTASMREDPRFGRLTRALGLESYWQQTRTKPDYRT